MLVRAVDVRAGQREITDNLDELLAALPPRFQERLRRDQRLDMLIEVVCDLGRVPEARFPDGVTVLDERPVLPEDLEYVVSRVGAFTRDNRAGIERTLHRISALRNRLGEVVGLTCRVGRAVYGTVEVVRDVIESGKSVLLVGRPGVGKTTLLREAARILADDLAKRVMIVDTSNEIAGDGDVPHPGIGNARRMQVPAPDLQHAVMIEAVENHMPEVVVIDEIGTEAEASAARTIAERGVQLIATAHGESLENLVANPTLSDLVGGIQAVTLGDEEARRRSSQKTVLERKARPTFEVVIEIRDRDRFAVHHDVAGVVDALLRHRSAEPEIRVRHADGSVEVEGSVATRESAEPERLRRRQRIFPYAVSHDRVAKAVQALNAPVAVTSDVDHADLVLTLQSVVRKQPRRLREMMKRQIPVHGIASSSQEKIEEGLRELLGMDRLRPQEERSLREAEEAVVVVIAEHRPVELSPQGSYLRRLQHQLVEAYGLRSKSTGREPFRHVVVRPAAS